MKKICLLFGLVLLTFVMVSQNNDEAEVLRTMKRIGTNTQSMDTLYLYDCGMARDIENLWCETTKEELLIEGVEKMPIIVMVNSIEDLKKIILRIEGK